MVKLDALMCLSYLGYKIIARVSELTSKLYLIDKGPLPLTMKLKAIRQVALSEVQHLFFNAHI